MTLSRNLIVALLLILLISSLFSLLPEASWEKDGRGIPAYQPPVEKLDSRELVDFLVLSPFHQRIKRVSYQNGSLRLDFLVTGPLPDEQVIYGDLGRFIFGSFNRFRSLENVWARAMYRRGNEEQLLIGVVARREQFDPAEIDPDWNAEEMFAYMKDHFQVSFSPLWQTFRKKSPSD